jgi:5-(carboxyamino)imidazole ribonucleotide synthase
VAIAQAAVLAPVADVAATTALAAQCDVITFENEFIDCDGLQSLVAQGTRFRPGLEVLALVLDKRHQREFFHRIGLPNPRYSFLDGPETEAEVVAKAKPLGLPLVMKARRLGYDGYGTAIVKDLDQLMATWTTWGRAPVLLEELVPFTKELAVMVARSATGEIALYPTVETEQIDRICRRVVAPAAVGAAVASRMESLARTLVEALSLVGLVGLECFLTQDDRILVNEIAPRPHNSGHYTLDACATSQFEQLLRAVSDRPLGPTAMTAPPGRHGQPARPRRPRRGSPSAARAAQGPAQRQPLLVQQRSSPGPQAGPPHPAA